MLRLSQIGILLVCFQLGGVFSGSVFFKKGSPHVILGNKGVLSGKVLFSRDGRPFSAFNGIPYASIPGRFEEAELITEVNWEGVKSSVKPGPLCTQSPFMSGAGAAIQITTFGEEDCLNLNVYVPMNNTGKKEGYPVMVWVHGGGFMFGGGYGYGPRFFMDEDIILVTINYRLGVFGFLSTEDSVIPGNNGLKDIVLSLQWIQQNIRGFGGNPNKVTVFGESAGAAAVHYLLLSPTTNGLFHRAISQSGSALSSWAYYPNPREVALKLASFMKCPSSVAGPLYVISSEEIATCLKGASMTELNEAQFAFKSSWPMNLANFYFGPCKEPPEASGASSVTPFITESPFSLVTDKSLPLPEIPWMVGMTEDEGATMFAGVVLNHERLLNELDTNWEQLAPVAFDLAKLAPKEEHLTVAQKLRQFYFGTKPVSNLTRDALSNIYSDQMIGYGVYRSAVETAAKGKKNLVYLYQYAYSGPFSMMGMTVPCAEEEKKKIGHADEVILQFDMGQMSADAPPDRQQIPPGSSHETFSKNFIQLWASFAASGEPRHTWGNSAAKRWKAISRKETSQQIPLRWYRIETNPSQIEDPYNERMAFWDTLYNDHFKQTFIPSKDPMKKTEL